MMFRHPVKLGNPKERAFTLIEVLLAVSVFAIVLAAINSVFFGALRLRNKAVQSFETALPLQQALSFIQKDLEGIMLPFIFFTDTFSTTIQSSNNNNAYIRLRASTDIHTSSGHVEELSHCADLQKDAY